MLALGFAWLADTALMADGDQDPLVSEFLILSLFLRPLVSTDSGRDVYDG